jgi:hypothetical protein
MVILFYLSDALIF